MPKSTLLSAELIADQIALAKKDPRLRTNFNLHSDYKDPVQRFLNVLTDQSYVQPHSHSQVDCWEGFIILAGELCVLQFNELGAVTDRNILSSQGPLYGIELDSSQAHSIVSLSKQSVLFEYKQGPYDPSDDKIFPDWSIDPEHQLSMTYLNWLKSAQPGETCQLS